MLLMPPWRFARLLRSTGAPLSSFIAPLMFGPPLSEARMAIRAWSASFSSPATTFASGALAVAAGLLRRGLRAWPSGAGAVLVDEALADASSAVSTGGGTVFWTMSSRPAVRSSLTTGSIQSLYIAPTRPKCSRKLNAAMIVRLQSIWLARPPLTESGSCGRGCTGGGATNWKRNVVSPMTTLPRASSVSRIW